MLRVLHLSTLFPNGSRPNFGIFVERQIQAFAERPGVAVRVVAPLGVPPWPLSRAGRYRALARLPEGESWNGLDVTRPRFLNVPGTGGRAHVAMLTRALVPVLAEMRRDFPFDVIAAEFFFPDGPAAIALGRHFGVPVSIKARGSDIHRWALRPGTGDQVRAAGRAADGMLSVSDAMRDDMIALGMPGERIHCIVSGVDFERFALRDRAEAKGAFGAPASLVVSVGALIPVKGHDLLIDAVARLPDVSLWIAGEGPERPRLAARIARLGLGDRVRLLGAVPHDSIPELLAAADVMALASASEGLANAWLEALASGTPIVIPDVGGARQVLGNDDAGRIVARTPEAFAEAIAALLDSPPERESVRAQVEPFTWATNSARMHAYFASLVERSNRSSVLDTAA